MQDYFLKGWVGAIPETGEVRRVRFAKFIIAVNCGRADKPKKIWVRCTAWCDLADQVKREIFQGDLVAVNGRIADVEAWLDSTGKPKAALAVHVSEIFKSTAPGIFQKIERKKTGSTTPD